MGQHKPASDILNEYFALLDKRDARGALVLASRRCRGKYQRGVDGGMDQAETDIRFLTGSKVDFAGIQRHYSRGWKIWQSGGFKGAVKRFLKANPAWGTGDLGSPAERMRQQMRRGAH